MAKTLKYHLIFQQQKTISMSKTKKAHRAKVAKRNQRIQNEQRQYQKVVDQIREAREFSKANGDEGPGYRLTENPDPVRPNGLSHFLPLTGSESFDLHNAREVTIG
jgi:hypothetical protein